MGQIGRFLSRRPAALGADAGPFDVAVSGYTAHLDHGDATATTAAYAEAGATWCIDHPDDYSALDRLVQRGAWPVTQ